MLLVVGRIGRAHGVAGEATIEVRTDVPDERFYIGAKLFTEGVKKPPFSQLTIASLRDHNGILLLKFEEVSDRNGIEALRDTLLKAEVDMADEHQDEDEFHVQQLIGLKVALESGEVIGELEDVLNLPGQDLLAIKSATDGHEILIPFIYEFVPDVDLETGIITVVPPEGLLDLPYSGSESEESE